MFNRSRIPLPILKKGMHFASTFTGSPVRGFRPTLALRSRTENAPNPLSSTRSPSSKALVISLALHLQKKMMEAQPTQKVRQLSGTLSYNIMVKLRVIVFTRCFCFKSHIYRWLDACAGNSHDFARFRTN